MPLRCLCGPTTCPWAAQSLSRGASAMQRPHLMAMSHTERKRMARSSSLH